MFRCFEYTAFLRKAKGRHGTHSPFAYWLVDCVARLPDAPIAFNSNGIQSKKSSRFADKLLRELPQHALKLMDEKNAEKHKDLELVPQIIVINAPLNTSCYQQIIESRFHPDTIIILPQSVYKRNLQALKLLYEDARFHFTADCFYFALLSPRPGQAKQHFYLKLA